MALKETVVGKTTVREYTSIGEFYDYITKTPLNEAFRWKNLSSTKTGSNGWSGTGTFDEATELLRRGWEAGAKRLTEKMLIKEFTTENKTISRMVYDVVGFTPSVPRYVMGLPTNMINKHQFTTKQKVITINKDFSYNCYYSNEQIMEYSAATLNVVKKVEELGYRVNLNIIWGVSEDNTNNVIKIRIKNANERLSISKMAFPLAHTSMLRRLGFRYLETAPNITSGYTYGYGSPLSRASLQQHCKGEIVLPKDFTDVKQIMATFDEQLQK